MVASPVSAATAAIEASTIPVSAAVQSSASESTREGSAVEQSGNTAVSFEKEPFDFSYLFVLSLGLAGLFWIRRLSQLL